MADRGREADETRGRTESAGARAERELTAALGALTILLVVMLAAAVWVSRDLSHSAQRAYVEQAIPIKSSAQGLVTQMVNQETGVQGFIITTRPSSLQPYFAGRRGAARDLAALQRESASHRELRALLGRARAEIAALNRFFSSEISLVRSGPSGERLAQRRAEAGRMLFDDFRGTAGAIVGSTDRFVARTARAQDRRLRTLEILLGLVGAAALGVAFALVAIVPRRARRLVDERAERLAEEREVRATLERLLAVTPRFLSGGTAERVRRDICSAAVEAFGCAAASLWAVGSDELRLTARVPWEGTYDTDDRRAIDELPGLREALATARPLFVADLQAGAGGTTQRTAEDLGSGSLLNLPIAIGGVTQLMLGLLWRRRIDAPSPAVRLAAQRFADQAGLALEQVRRRQAQAEVESLNRTLQQMLRTDPLFRADGTPQEVAEAICDAGRRIFRATGAALWLQTADALELVCRSPANAALPAGIRLDLGDFASFAEDLGSGRPHFIADVEQDEPRLWSVYARHTRSLSQLRLPLASAGGANALIVLSWPSRVDPPTPQERAIAARFADQAAVALAEAERRVAQAEAEQLHATFELGLLPRIEVADARVRIATLYRPGDARLSLGGDFYDSVELPSGDLGVLIGDVAGHGPAAAALGAALRAAWRGLALAGAPVEDTMAALHRMVVRDEHGPEVFATAISARLCLDPPRVTLASAGHPPPLLLGAAPPAWIPPHPPLGVSGETPWEPVTLDLAAPAALVFYTDGLIEGRATPGAGERFGTARLERLLAERGAHLDDEDLRSVVDAVSAAHGDGLPDDVAVIVVNVRDGAVSRDGEA